MTILYLASFIGGLLLAVWVMMYGVERPREAHPDRERSFRISPPMIVAFAVIFGLAGYILTRRHAGGTGLALTISAVLGVIAAAISARLVKEWWKVTPEHEVDDERYVLQGHFARVTKPITADTDGEVAFEVGSEHHVVRAHGLDDAAIEAGSDVVIERIENDVAYVEAWMEVEKRL